jgi:hypothetical protein
VARSIAMIALFNCKQIEQWHVHTVREYIMKKAEISTSESILGSDINEQEFLEMFPFFAKKRAINRVLAFIGLTPRPLMVDEERVNFARNCISQDPDRADAYVEKFSGSNNDGTIECLQKKIFFLKGLSPHECIYKINPPDATKLEIHQADYQFLLSSARRGW